MAKTPVRKKESFFATDSSSLRASLTSFRVASLAILVLFWLSWADSVAGRALLAVFTSSSGFFTPLFGYGAA